MRQRSIYFALLTCFALLAMASSIAGQPAGQDIVSRLLPDGDPHRMVDPGPAEKSTAIKQLRSVQKSAHDERSVEATFLLAAYGSDFEKNRDALIDNLRGCTTPAIKYGCDGNIAEYLITLYQRGHKDVLKPLMLVGKNSYSAVVAENLGSFLATLLSSNPDVFFETTREFTPEAREDLCELAGTGDGDGLSAEKLEQVRKELKGRNDELSVACLQAIETANRRD